MGSTSTEQSTPQQPPRGPNRAERRRREKRLRKAAQELARTMGVPPAGIPPPDPAAVPAGANPPPPSSPLIVPSERSREGSPDKADDPPAEGCPPERAGQAPPTVAAPDERPARVGDDPPARATPRPWDTALSGDEIARIAVATTAPDRERAILARLLAWIPLERLYWGGEIPAGRLFLLLLREICRGVLLSLSESGDEDLAGSAEARLELFEQRLDAQLERHRRAAGNQAPPASSPEEERAVLAQAHAWLAMAAGARSAEAFARELEREPGVVRFLAGPGSPAEVAGVRARPVARAFWRLLYGSRKPRSRLRLASDRYRVMLSRKDWLLPAQQLWSGVGEHDTRFGAAAGDAADGAVTSGTEAAGHAPARAPEAGAAPPR